jgi:hypothetical protein
MLVAAIILSALVLLALLRFGLIIEYCEAGFGMWYKIGFVKLKLLDKIELKRAKRKVAKKKTPGDLKTFLETLKASKNMLARLKRRLLINKLILHYTSASEDAAKTAIGFGAANAVFGAIIPVLERSFKIKRRDLRVMVNYEAKKPMIYAKVAVSLAVWEGIYIIFALLPAFSARAASSPKTRSEKAFVNTRKDGPEYGKQTN